MELPKLIMDDKGKGNTIKGVETEAGTWLFHRPHKFLGVLPSVMHKARPKEGEWEFNNGRADNRYSLFVGPIDSYRQPNGTFRLKPDYSRVYPQEPVQCYYYFGINDGIEEYPATKLKEDMIYDDCEYLKLQLYKPSNDIEWVKMKLRREDIDKFTNAKRKSELLNDRAPLDTMIDFQQTSYALRSSGGSRKRNPKKLRKRKTRRSRR